MTKIYISFHYDLENIICGLASHPQSNLHLEGAARSGVLQGVALVQRHVLGLQQATQRHRHRPQRTLVLLVPHLKQSGQRFGRSSHIPRLTRHRRTIKVKQMSFWRQYLNLQLLAFRVVDEEGEGFLPHRFIGLIFGLEEDRTVRRKQGANHSMATCHRRQSASNFNFNFL